MSSPTIPSFDTFNPERVGELAAAIAAFGIENQADGVRRFAAAARRAGFAGTLVDTLVDAGTAAVARERAFGRLAELLARSPAALVAAA